MSSTSIPSKLVQSYGKAAVKLYQSCIKRHSVPLPTDDIKLLRLSAVQAAQQIRDGTLKSKDLVSAYLDRIHLVNPYIHAAVQIFEHEALVEAERVDNYISTLDKAARTALADTQPFLGVPVSVKASMLLKGKRPIVGLVHRRNIPKSTETATAVQRVIDAGAIPICHTNTPAACLWLESTNKVFGVSTTAYDTRTTPGGSSGGEGALLGAEGSVIGIGSDIAGSIRVPAAFNGVFGLHASGTVPIYGHYPPLTLDDGSDIPFCKEMASFGPMGRYAEDCTKLYSVMSKTSIPADFADKQPKSLFYSTLKSPLISDITPEMKNIQRFAVNFLQTTFPSIPLQEYVPPDHHKMIKIYENQVSPPGVAPISSLLFPEGKDKPIDNYIEQVRAALGVSEIRLEGTALIGFFGSSTGPKKHAEYAAEIEKDRKALHDILEGGVLVAPPMPQTHYFHGEQVAAITDYWCSAMWNYLSCPSMTVPMGLSNDGDYPLSVLLVTTTGNEYLLLSLAEKLSKAFGGWQPAKPGFE